MSTATQTRPEVATPPVTDTLPDGDALGNDILAGIGQAEIKALLRKGGQSVKARKGSSSAPRVMFQPQAWTMGGQVD